ncbi:MAG: FAD-dependent oxidoreductase, partial [Planctomycetes bacterium]|nr:FAD-dependent oxidoreductase [Planctomycetota bacterium]
AVTAKVVIDATGDGDVAARAGCRYELGRPSDGLLQPMTLMFEVRGLGDWEMNDARVLYDAMAEAIEHEKIDFELPFPRVKYAPWIITVPARGAADVQLTHVYRLNTLDPADLTRGTIDARRQVHKAMEVLRHVPGLEGIELVQTAPQIGIREGRRIRGRHWLTLAELQAGCTFPDSVASCGFVVDIHEPDPRVGTPPKQLARIQPYEIPYRSLVAEDVRGLLTAGRCISGSHEAHASYRVTGTCAATGQAAGLAAAWATADSLDLQDVPGERLRAALAERGAKFLDSGMRMSVPEA